MTSAACPDSLPDEVIDAAVHWAVRLGHGVATPASTEAFEQWLQASSLHAKAWSRVSALRDDFAQLPAASSRDALQAVDTGRSERQRGRRQALKLLSMAGMAATVGWGIRAHAPWQRLLADASTAVGEQRTLRLAGGTVLMLNTDSAVDIDLDPAYRLIRFWRGEIMVSTGSDPGASARRPFWVDTPMGRLQALGTRFMVRLEQGRALVIVQEGAVALHPSHMRAEAGAAAIVRAGERRWLMREGTAPAAALPFDAEAWVDGVIAGRDLLLRDLLAELERYRPGRIICDERVADMRVSGVFHTQDTDQTLHFLAQTQALAIRQRTPYWVSVGPAVR